MKSIQITFDFLLHSCHEAAFFQEQVHPFRSQDAGGWSLQFFIPLNESLSTGFEIAFSSYDRLDGVPLQFAGCVVQVIIAFLGNLVDFFLHRGSQRLHSFNMNRLDISWNRLIDVLSDCQ